MIGLYIHIPFCKKRCNYCSFFSTPSSDIPQLFIDALIQEIQGVDEYPVKTIYLGGGTPSLLTPSQVEDILNAAYNHFSNSPTEITIEVNPESIDEIKLVAYKKLGINRLSIGAQSLNNRRLESLGRIHDTDMVIQVYKQARRAGFDNINLDLIYGLPDQPLTSIELDALVALDPEHVSTYCLSIEAGTPFSELLTVVDEEQSIEEYEMIRQALNRMYHYELSAFSKKGKHSIHNSLYWQREEFLGIGAGASSFIAERRWRNTESIGEYCASPLQGYVSGMQSPILSAYEKALEFVMLGLRLTSGLSIDILEEYCFPVLDNSKKKVNSLLHDGFLEQDGKKIWISPTHLFISDSIISEITG